MVRKPSLPAWASAARFVESGQGARGGCVLRLGSPPYCPRPRLPSHPRVLLQLCGHIGGICKPPYPTVFCVVQSLRPVKAREFRSQQFSVSDNSPAAPRARARLQGTGLRVAALLKWRETGLRPRRTWLAWSQAPKIRGSRVPLGPPLSLRPSGLLLRTHTAAWRALTRKRFGSRGLTGDLVQTKRELQAHLESGTSARSSARIERDLRRVPRPGAMPAFLRRPARLAAVPPRPRSGLSSGVPSSPRRAPSPAGRGHRAPSPRVEWGTRARRAKHLSGG